MAKYRQLRYTITYDKIKDEKITPKIEDLMAELHGVATAGAKNGSKLIEKTIKEYPAFPQFKNYLSIWYHVTGNEKKAIAVNDDIIKKHPDYLFAKINKAAICIENRDFEGVEELLGKSLDLKDLYPHRDEFHVSEVEAMLNVAVQYYMFKGDFEQARVRLNILKEINPKSIIAPHFEKFIQATEALSDKRDFMDEYIEEEEDMDFDLESALLEYMQNSMRTTIDQPKTRKKTSPKFKNKEVNVLYRKLNLEASDLDMFLSLPRLSLIQDLETVLDDSINRYTYFSDKEFDESEFNFVINTLLILKELKAVESLPKVLYILAQSEEYLDLFFSDLLPEYGWQFVYALGNEQTDVLLDYVKIPLLYTYTKDAVATAVTQTGVYQPKRRKEVIKWLKEVMKYYISCDKDEIDSGFIELLVGNAVDLQASELKTEIKKLDKLGYIGSMLFTDVEEVLFHLTGNLDDIAQQEFRSFEDISNVLSRSDIDEELDEEDLFNELFLNKFGNKPIVNAKKVERNDLCPCGSGKKYKKCCLIQGLNT
ncbi:SEC-C metal-binding domain-containing protein [Myroides marinus]|uniref:SEC-C metal-binding domain-containing protein n=1 Tax=Myroides marinus TaxID=703342 RepID=UPI0025780F80|nr:SEC-C metal-binding domain-containing protein [Myroides marinus]MDM1373662.1 SEC-C domain-containing protein [Myroides marinus]MDM1531762.1 SEC-C domain-containing protein [Myroides marinus]MDM1538814.1 SEC-C domain-containing protein [Myroides marinus]